MWNKLNSQWWSTEQHREELWIRFDFMPNYPNKEIAQHFYNRLNVNVHLLGVVIASQRSQRYSRAHFPFAPRSTWALLNEMKEILRKIRKSQLFASSSLFLSFSSAQWFHYISCRHCCGGWKSFILSCVGKSMWLRNGDKSLNCRSICATIQSTDSIQLAWSIELVFILSVLLFFPSDRLQLVPISSIFFFFPFRKSFKRLCFHGFSADCDANNNFPVIGVWTAWILWDNIWAASYSQVCIMCQMQLERYQLPLDLMCQLFDDEQKIARRKAIRNANFMSESGHYSLFWRLFLFVSRIGRLMTLTLVCYFKLNKAICLFLPFALHIQWVALSCLFVLISVFIKIEEMCSFHLARRCHTMPIYYDPIQISKIDFLSCFPIGFHHELFIWFVENNFIYFFAVAPFDIWHLITIFKLIEF